MSLRKAINDKCRDCIYDQKSGMGTWRQQVSACTVYPCPLWPVRPLAEAMLDGSQPPKTEEASREWRRNVGDKACGDVDSGHP